MEILAATAVFLLALAGIAVIARQPAPRARSPARRSPARQRKSVLVTAAKAAGVKVGSDQLSHATAELAGKAAGGTGRGTGRLTRWGGRWAGRAGLAAGRWAERRAGRRWQARTAPTPLLWRHHDPAPNQPEPTGESPAAGQPGPADRPAAADGPPPGPGPAPPGNTTTTAAPPAASPVPTTTAPDGAPAAPHAGAGRNTTMRHRYSVNLERPATDAEFLESCVQLGDVLKALAEEVSEWADSLSGLNLPQSVLAPLHLVSEGIEEAATGASQSAKSFEDEFEDARDVASRGMHFTGEDAA